MAWYIFQGSFWGTLMYAGLILARLLEDMLKTLFFHEKTWEHTFYLLAAGLCLKAYFVYYFIL